MRTASATAARLQYSDVFAVSGRFKILDKTPRTRADFWKQHLKNPFVWMGMWVVLVIITFVYDAVYGCQRRSVASERRPLL